MEALAQHFAQLLIRKRLTEKTPQPSTEEDQDFHSVNVNGIASSETKFIGPEYVGLEAMRSLGFFDLFGQLGFTETQCDFATLLIVGRLVHPSSERELSRYATEQSGLDELLQSSFAHIGQNALYLASDLLILTWKPGPMDRVRDDRLCLRSTLFFVFRFQVSGFRKLF